MAEEVLYKGQVVYVSEKKGHRCPEIFEEKKEPKPRKPQELTDKQKKAKAAYIALGATEDVKSRAGMIAGYHPNAAIRGVNSAIRPIVGILKGKGVDDELIADRIKEGLNAKHPFKPDQEDHHARHKFVKEYNTLAGNYPPKQIQAQVQQAVIMLTKDDLAQDQKVDRIREENDRDPL